MAAVVAAISRADQHAADAALAELELTTLAERLRHLRYYQRMTRLLTPLFQSDRGRFFAALRDLSMALACKIGPLRRMMVTTVLGIKRGLLRRSLPLAPLYDAPRLLPAAPPEPAPAPPTSTSGPAGS